MALKHVVLGVVGDSPAHGYGIHADLAEALPVARPCDSSRVYAVLIALEREGWVGATWEDAGRGRMRKRYRLEPAGGRELERWLATPRPGGALLRRDVLLRLALALGGTRWEQTLERRLLRREGLLRVARSESRLARLFRLRELAHLEAELRALREIVLAD